MTRISHLASRIVVLLTGVLFAFPASAALLFSEPRQIEVAPSQIFEVGLYLDTEQEDINAIEGTIMFPTDLLELKEIRDGNSIINFWIERPALGQVSTTFSGIIPGGYRFPKGLVLSFVFQAKGNGMGSIRVERARTLRNDGQGTETPLTLAFSSITISENPEFPLPIVTPIVDNEAPESFRPEISRDPSIFSDKWFISFATQDKGSGIDHYEVRESYAWGWGSWQKATSPYMLMGQNPSFPINVKAVDKSGNERIVAVVPITHVRTLIETLSLYGIIILIVLLLVIRERVRIFQFLNRMRRK